MSLDELAVYLAGILSVNYPTQGINLLRKRLIF